MCRLEQQTVSISQCLIYNQEIKIKLSLHCTETQARESVSSTSQSETSVLYKKFADSLWTDSEFLKHDTVIDCPASVIQKHHLCGSESLVPSSSSLEKEANEYLFSNIFNHIHYNVKRLNNKLFNVDDPLTQLFEEVKSVVSNEYDTDDYSDYHSYDLQRKPDKSEILLHQKRVTRFLGEIQPNDTHAEPYYSGTLETASHKEYADAVEVLSKEPSDLHLKYSAFVLGITNKGLYPTIFGVLHSIYHLSTLGIVASTSLVALPSIAIPLLSKVIDSAPEETIRPLHISSALAKCFALAAAAVTLTYKIPPLFVFLTLLTISSASRSIMVSINHHALGLHIRHRRYRSIEALRNSSAEFNPLYCGKSELLRWAEGLQTEKFYHALGTCSALLTGGLVTLIWPEVFAPQLLLAATMAAGHCVFCQSSYREPFFISRNKIALTRIFANEKPLSTGPSYSHITSQYHGNTSGSLLFLFLVHSTPGISEALHVYITSQFIDSQLAVMTLVLSVEIGSLIGCLGSRYKNISSVRSTILKLTLFTLPVYYLTALAISRLNGINLLLSLTVLECVKESLFAAQLIPPVVACRSELTSRNCATVLSKFSLISAMGQSTSGIISGSLIYVTTIATAPTGLSAISVYICTAGTFQLLPLISWRVIPN